MNREEFLKELERLLADIPEDERKDALDYYYDYLDSDSGEDEADKIAALGTPEELAGKIKLASGVNSIVEGEFSETGYSDSMDTTYDVPDKYTQIAESNNTTGNSEKKYNIFGVTITKSVLILLLIIALLVIPGIFSIIGGFFGFAGRMIGKTAKLLTKVSPFNTEKSIEDTGIVTTDGNEVVIGEGKGIEDLDIEVGAVSFYIKESPDGNITVKYDNELKVVNKSDSGKLKLKVGRENNISDFSSDSTVELYIPNDMKLDEANFDIGAAKFVCDTSFTCNSITVKLGAGEAKFVKVTSENADLDLGAGKLTFDKLITEDADIDVDMGDFTMKGDIKDDLDLDVAMGNATIDLDSNESDHDYKVEVGMGNLDLFKTKFSGMGKSDKIDNDSESEYDIEVGMGNITIK